MNSEKVKEIKEKLQEEIFIANSFGDKLRKVPTKELENLLTLINELESENERLKWEKQTLEDKDTLLAKVGEMVQENQQLKDQIALLEKDNERLKILLAQANAGIVNCSGCKLVELNAVKEFAEKLKKKAFDKDMFNDWAGATYVVLVREIDELLKEYEKCDK